MQLYPQIALVRADPKTHNATGGGYAAKAAFDVRQAQEAAEPPQERRIASTASVPTHCEKNRHRGRYKPLKRVRFWGGKRTRQG